MLITKKMRTFFGRAVSIALITVLSDALVKGNRAKFLPYSSDVTNTGNGERGTGNGERGTGNREQESGN